MYTSDKKKKTDNIGSSRLANPKACRENHCKDMLHKRVKWRFFFPKDTVTKQYRLCLVQIL